MELRLFFQGWKLFRDCHFFIDAKVTGEFREEVKMVVTEGSGALLSKHPMKTQMTNGSRDQNWFVVVPESQKKSDPAEKNVSHPVKIKSKCGGWWEVTDEWVLSSVAKYEMNFNQAEELDLVSSDSE